MTMSSWSHTEKALMEMDSFEEFNELNNGVLCMADPEVATEEEEPSEVEDFKKFLKTEGLTAVQIMEELQGLLSRWKMISLDIGIIGNAGCGKSTFINTLRRLKPSDPRAAKSGVTQTTEEPTKYEHPEYPNVRFWDLPGAGTPDFPRETYQEKINFDKYDYYIILICTRFTENDLWYARLIQRAGKHFYFLRTKVDIDIRNDRDDYPETHVEETVLKRIKDDILAQLKKAAFKEPPVFLVCKYPNLYDFPAFEKRVLHDLPELKKEVLLFIARTHAEEITRKTTKNLKIRSWLISFASAAIAALPVPFLSPVVDTGIVSSELLKYTKMYGLDEDSLRELGAVRQQNAAQILFKVMNNHCIVGATTGAVKCVMSGGSIALSVILKGGLKFIPIIGAVFSAAMSLTTTKLHLGKAIAAMEEASLAIYTKVYSDTALSAITL